MKALSGETDAVTEAVAAKPAAKAKTSSKATAAKKTTDLLLNTANEIENLTKAKALAMAKALIEEEGVTDFKLGGVLSVIQANSYWQSDDHTSFKDFVTDIYGMPYRKSMYLIQIYNDLIECGVEWSKVKNIGWTKLKEISKVLDSDNVDEWVQRAQDMTVVQLQEYIKQLNAVDGSSDSAEQKATATTTMTFKVHDDQKEVIQQAIDSAKEKVATEFPAVALESICMAYIEGGLGKASTGGNSLGILGEMKKLTVDEVLEAFEQIFPEVNITAEM